MSDNSCKTRTEKEFSEVKKICRDTFLGKMQDYGTSWRIMRPKSLTDQILIKAMRIRKLEESKDARVDEGIEPEFIGIVNYCAMALIQLELEPGDNIPCEEALRLYDMKLQTATSPMSNKNHDYDEAWRYMRVSSITDIILQKLRRTKEIEDHDGNVGCSEGLDANYLDMINYSLFALIKLNFPDDACL